MARIAPPVLRALPRRVKPFPGETSSSYVARLAHANRLDATALRCYITADRRSSPPMSAERLSIVAGIPAQVLRNAIPNLDPAPGRAAHRPLIPRHGDDGPACRMCVLARGITQPVRCWKQPEQVICLRHRRWIAPLAEDDQPALREHPEILHAHKRHLRLVRRFGRDPTANMYAVADHICRRWHEQHEHDAGFRQRMAAFHGPDWHVRPADPTIAAAIYPQVVALTRLLVSPYWQHLGKSGWAGRQRFLQELRATVAAGYVWPTKPQSADPLHRWTTQQHLVKPDPFLFSSHGWPLPPSSSHEWADDLQSSRSLPEYSFLGFVGPASADLQRNRLWG